MKAPLFIRKRRSVTADYREMRKKYRRDKRDRARQHFRDKRSKTSFILGGTFSVGGALTYWGWAAVNRMTVDAVGLLLAAAAPPVLYGIGVWINGYRRAAVLAYGRYRAEHESLNPPTPWQAFSEVIPGEMGARIALRLGLSRRYTAAEAKEVSCVLYTDADFGTGFKVKEPRRNVRLASGASSPVADAPIEFCYPDDFLQPKWPLEPGKYPIVWNVIDGEGRSIGLGDEVKIRKRRA